MATSQLRSPPTRSTAPRRSKRIRTAAPPPPPSPLSSPNLSASSLESSESEFEPTTSPPSTPSPVIPASPSSPPPPNISPSSYTRTAFSSVEEAALRHALQTWYVEQHRKFPWRAAPTYTGPSTPPTARPAPSSLPHTAPGAPYAIWISEVMSQQTRISVAATYYTRWMTSFPSPTALANASLEDVNTHWAGLGYYRRAAYLHKAAHLIVAHHKGSLPDTQGALLKLPGIGRYTAAAIASIAFNIPVGLVDGNVERVLSRLLPTLSTTPNPSDHYWRIANALLAPCTSPGDLNQSLMELGATICTPRLARCAECPVRKFCGAHEEAVSAGCADDPAGYVVRYPIKRSGKAAIKVRDETLAAIVCVAYIDGHAHFLLRRRPSTGLLAGLWEAPNQVLAQMSLTDILPERVLDGHETVEQAVLSQTVPSGEDFVKVRVEVGVVTHVFSHIRQSIVVRLLVLRSKRGKGLEVSDGVWNDGSPFRWLPKSDIASAAVSTQMKKVFAAAFKKMPMARRVRDG